MRLIVSCRLFFDAIPCIISVQATTGRPYPTATSHLQSDHGERPRDSFSEDLKGCSVDNLVVHQQLNISEANNPWRITARPNNRIRTIGYFYFSRGPYPPETMNPPLIPLEIPFRKESEMKTSTPPQRLAIISLGLVVFLMALYFTIHTVTKKKRP